MDHINIRINNIQFQTFTDTQGEFKLWYPNKYYGKLQEYLKDGWEDKGEYIVGERGSGSLSKSMFSSQEHCYIIAWLKYSVKDEVCDLCTVGDRMLRLENIKDFMEVYAIANKKMMERINKEE